MFEFDLSDKCRKSLEKLGKKDKKISKAVVSKIKEIISRDLDSIDFYKNLRGKMKEFKRVHITEYLVLVFKVYKKEKYIKFVKLAHRKDVYKLK